MAYNTVSIKKDVDGKPIPQLYNPISNEYEVLQGQNGASRSILYDTDGNPVDLTGLISAIIDILNAKHLPTGASTAAKQDEILTVLNNLYNRDTTRTYYGKSTDTKPTSDVVIGSTFFEIDTLSVYMWDGTGWVVI